MQRARWLAIALVVAFLGMVASADAAVWKSRTSGTPNDLDAVSCPSSSTCYAFGQVGTIVKSVDGGDTWSAQSSGAAGFLRGACSSTSTCVAAGDAGVIVQTTNGGSTWTPRSSGTLNNLRAVSCPGSTCVAVGWNGTIVRSTDGGATWTTRTSGTLRHLRAVTCSGTCVATGDLGTVLTSSDGGDTWTMRTSGTTQGLFGVTCPGACYAVGLVGTILRSDDGGVTWTQKSSGTSNHLRGIACPGDCYAVGDVATIRASGDGGNTWRAEPLDTTHNLESVACASSTMCLAVGDVGTVLSARFPTTLSLAPATQARGVGQAATVEATVSDQDGDALSGVNVKFSRAGANPAPETTRTTGSAGSAAYSYTGTAQGADTVTATVPDGGASGAATVVWGPNPLYPSGGCDGAGTNVFDGYAGNAYLKLRTRPDPANPGATWVCVAADAGGQHFGGRVAVTGTVSVPAAIDDEHEQCDANPASRIVDEPGQVGPVPFDLDVNRFASGDVWICVSADGSTIAKRLRIETAAPSTVTFVPDSTAPFPFYVERPPTGGASAACQAAPTGKARVLNADVGSHHVWLYTWTESTSRVHACTRVEGPGGPAGGRLTLDGNGIPALPTVDSSSDFSPCATNLLTLGTPPLSAKIHAGSPAWVCLRADGTYRRVKLDTTGGQPLVSFTPDA